jgi:hypothetical protein
MVQFKRPLRYWLMRLAHFAQERVDAMDPNWRGIFVGLIIIILICAAGCIPAMTGSLKLADMVRLRCAKCGRSGG